MSEIPEDIAKTAHELAFYRGLGPVCEGAVARAILAERKRCAEVVHSVAKDFYGNTDQMYAAALIASSIEAGA